MTPVGDFDRVAYSDLVKERYNSSYDWYQRKPRSVPADTAGQQLDRRQALDDAGFGKR